MATVFVGLSGGVDSAVSAALLKERGHTVVGAFIKIWSPEFIECTWKEDRLDAMRVAAALQIPFLEVDLSEEYKKEVVGDMIANYSQGVTPNPDVLCNRTIKFGHFAEWAFKNGADSIATGHYARIRSQEGSHQLLRGLDTNKDQSYFLYQLTQEDLARALFPVGEFEKPQVRELAHKFNLPNASRPDSQGLCFVGDVSLKEFLGRFIELKKGDVMDEQGTRIGSHDGAALYTIGERHGFTATGSGTHFVTDIDVDKNIVHVSGKREDANRRRASVAQPHWIGSVPLSGTTLQAQARYREHPFEVKIDESAGVLDVTFDDAHLAAPGQSLVLYQDEICLGGGIINSLS
ncbi:MAG: tRNA 2-thiouridine(34) synthase MnmA [Candidatus Pacebacteria bacterium]|nr:tRNA 2-thiouridine(34) synthase MnmA [Candidatus Paceibacterota bacterium]